VYERKPQKHVGSRDSWLNSHKSSGWMVESVTKHTSPLSTCCC